MINNFYFVLASLSPDPKLHLGRTQFYDHLPNANQPHIPELKIKKIIKQQQKLPSKFVRFSKLLMLTLMAQGSRMLRNSRLRKVRAQCAPCTIMVNVTFLFPQSSFAHRVNIISFNHASNRTL